MLFPPYLKAGDKVGIIAPAGPIEYPQDIEEGLRVLRSWGLEVVMGRTPSLKHFQFAGTDEERTFDLQTMLDDPEIRAVIAVRGGYGTSRIIDRIDFTRFFESPKWLVGFSDITLLLSHLARLGYASIHGPMVKHLGREDHPTECLRALLFGEALTYEMEPHPFNRFGSVTAPLCGGNLCLLAHSLGSPSEIETEGKILFLEDVGERLYNIDRMLWQLRRAGKLENLAGMMVGQFTETTGTPAGFGMDVDEIIAEHIKDNSYPVAYGLPVGHVRDNHPLMIGQTAELQVSSEGAAVSFPV